MTTADSPSSPRSEEPKDPSYLIFDTESVPDGRLVRLVKYPKDSISDAEAIQRAQVEARERYGTDFLPVSFQIPVAICVIRVDADFRLQSITNLGAPHFHPGDITKKFWQGISLYPRAELVTYNGRCFDLPLLELAAFRYGHSAQGYFLRTRDRYRGNHTDLLELFSNFGAVRLAGGLNLLSKILGKPGKMDVTGDQVYAMYQEGKKQEISDYCMFDTLDTYFVFLRSRVLTGQLTLEQEQALVRDEARAWIVAKVGEIPALQQYLDNWGAWEPWP
jgi:predicted PolB exonuclease-like 3'-5' exonuclease